MPPHDIAALGIHSSLFTRNCRGGREPRPYPQVVLLHRQQLVAQTPIHHSGPKPVCVPPHPRVVSGNARHRCATGPRRRHSDNARPTSMTANNTRFTNGPAGVPTPASGTNFNTTCAAT